MQAIFKSTILGSIVATIGLLSFWLVPGYDLEENLGLELLFKVRGSRPAPDNVVIIAIDKVASDYYQLPNIPAKWPRQLHTQLIEILASKQATVIAIDIFFKDAKDKTNDQLFANAIKKSNNVVLFTHLKRELLNEFGTTPRTQAAELFNIERLIYPTPVIAQASKALAPFALPKYPAKVSKFWTFRIPAGEIATLPVVVLQLLLSQHKNFIANLRLLEKINNITFPRLNSNSSNQAITKFISDMKDWSKQNKSSITEIVNALYSGHYNAYFDQNNKKLLLQFFNLYNAYNQHYLNFIGPPRSITTITYDAVLNNKLPTNFSFKNKVVFIGFSERIQPEQIDNFNTVFSQKNGVDLSGVEIGATAFSNLHDLNSITTLNHINYLLLIAIFGFLAAFIARTLSSVSAIFTLMVISLSYFGFSYYLFNTYSLWLPIIIPLFVLMPLSLFSSIGWQFIETNKERNQIRKAFGFYLPDSVVNELAKKKATVQNSQNLVYGICMATDAEHYTSMSENLTPNTLSVLINKYYEILFNPVRSNQGIISDVVGDAMLAIWTAHNPNQSLRQNACYAAIEVQHNLLKLQQKKEQYALTTRIGLHSGNIVIGNVGAIDHYEYRAVGDIVNTTNRIQGLNKHLQTKIIASHDTIRDIPNLLIRELGNFKLAGKSKDINLYEIIDFKSNSTPEIKQLIINFKSALCDFKIGNVELALQKFNVLLEIFPTDGPSHFYKNYCECIINDKSYVKSLWTGVISMKQK